MITISTLLAAWMQTPTTFLIGLAIITILVMWLGEWGSKD